MPFIPRAVCVRCKIPLTPEKNGVVMHAYSGRYYYSIDADLWKCPKCGTEIIVGFANQPFNMNFESEYKKPKLKNRVEYEVKL